MNDLERNGRIRAIEARLDVAETKLKLVAYVGSIFGTVFAGVLIAIIVGLIVPG